MREQILRLKQEGKTYNEIKEIVGCSKGTISYYCGEGQKEKTSQRRIDFRRKNQLWLEEFKKTLKCSKCEESRHWVLDFHHTNPEEKEKSVSKLIKTSTKEKVLEEIDKCVVLCSNCHRDLHYQENKMLR